MLQPEVGFMGRSGACSTIRSIKPTSKKYMDAFVTIFDDREQVLNADVPPNRHCDHPRNATHASRSRSPFLDNVCYGDLYRYTAFENDMQVSKSRILPPA